MFITLISGLIAGPAVSLSGSPTVSPVTLALCFSRVLAGLVGSRLVLDHLLGVVPRAAGVGHEHGQQLADHDHAGQEAAERERPEQEADEERRADRQQTRADQFLLRGAGADVDDAAVVGLLLPGQDFLVAELPAALVDDQVRGAADGADRHRAEQERHGAADQHADEDERLGDGELRRARGEIAD